MRYGRVVRCESVLAVHSSKSIRVSGGEVSRGTRIDLSLPLRSDGAGLGLSIVSTIVQRMSGTVEVRSKPGEGTVVTLALPMTFIQPSKPVDTTPASSPLYRRRCISDELAALFTPGSPDSLVNSPPLTSAISGSSVAESAAARLNFGQAIEAAQASTKLARVPSRRKRPPQTPGVVEPSELIAEAAKLSLTTVAATMASGSVDKSPVLEGMNKVEATAGAAAVASGRRANVLVADDNRIALNILSKLFTSKVSTSLSPPAACDRDFLLVSVPPS